MRKTNTVSISQIINEILREYKIDDKIKEVRIISAWSEVLGAMANPSDELYIKNKVLFAKLSSSVIRNELYMRRSALVRMLNEKAGEEVITDVVLR